MFPFVDLLERNRDLVGNHPAVYGLEDAEAVLAVRAAYGAVPIGVDALAAVVAGVSAHAPWPVSVDGVSSLVAVLPKGRARAGLLAAASSAAVPSGTRLLAIGENRLGARSALSTLERWWDHVEKVDAARHCSVYAGVARGGAFDVSPWVTTYEASFRGRVVPATALAGTFSADGLDPATEMLLRVLGDADIGGRVLDLGCGTGVIAAALAPQCVDVVAADASATAIWAAKRTLTGVPNATVLASDGYGAIEGTFDRIVSNPPFHDGAAVDLDAALGFISGAPAMLRPGGALYLVANRFLRYLDPLRAVFRDVDVVEQDGRFAVYRARRPVGS